jgi:hypothetical protein
MRLDLLFQMDETRNRRKVEIYSTSCTGNEYQLNEHNNLSNLKENLKYFSVIIFDKNNIK